MFVGPKVPGMEVSVGHGVIVRHFNVANTVDLVAGQNIRHTFPQMLTYTLVHLLVWFREV